MKIRDVMTFDVESAAPGTPLKRIARMMRDGDIGAVPVEDHERLVGLVTDRDIVVRAVAEGLDERGCVAADVMSEDVLTCFADDDAHRIAELMSDHQVRRLPVLDSENRVIGVVSLGDLSLRDRESAGLALGNISQPSLGARA
ncbi:MAG TPA: CBS domain-containing protein [Sphingomonas sp.]|nr:CBS domain-containing protein [Sphingomonas sp.]